MIWYCFITNHGKRRVSQLEASQKLKAALLLQRWWRNELDVRAGRKVRGAFTKDFVRALIAKSKQQKAVKARIIKIVRYTLFLSIFTADTILSHNDGHTYYLQNAIKQQLTMPRSPLGKQFTDIATVGGWYSFVNSTLLPAIYDSDPTRRASDDKLRYTTILTHSYVIGGIRIGQIRGKRQQCDSFFGAPESDPPNTVNCASRTFVDSEDTEDFGPFQYKGWNGTDTAYERRLPFTYSSANVNRASYHKIPSPAFSVVLPNSNLTEARRLLAFLQSNNYVDEQTKALAVDLSVINPSVAKLIAIRLLVEMPRH